MRATNGLVLASLNGGKLSEFQALFARHKIQVLPFESFVRNATFLAQVESEAPSASYYENAFRKCFAAFQAAKLPTVADDSGLEIDALAVTNEFHTQRINARSVELQRELFVATHVVRNLLAVFRRVPLNFERHVGPLVWSKEVVLESREVVLRRVFQND